jgi:hypothetical protein
MDGWMRVGGTSKSKRRGIWAELSWTELELGGAVESNDRGSSSGSIEIVLH